MLIAALQCDVQTGDFIKNQEILLLAARKGFEAGALICAAPIQTLAGPDPLAWQSQPDFESACLASLDRLARHIPAGRFLICGAPFFSGQTVLIGGGSWFAPPQNYSLENINIFFADGPEAPEKDRDLVFRLSAYPYSPDSQAAEEKACAWIARKAGAFVIQPNLYGGYGDVIYAGAGFALAPSGKIIARAPAFQETILLIDTDSSPLNIIAPYPDRNESQWLALCAGIRDYARKSNAAKVVLGLSGGMDSALVCCLAKEAMGPENVLAVMLPSPYSSEGSITDSKLLCRNLDVEFCELPIRGVMEACDKCLAPLFDKLPGRPGDLTAENIQPRIRGLILMAIANRQGSLVLNTGNRSEAFMGYSTLYGDTVGAISVLGDLYKSRIYELALWYNEKNRREIIPRAILTKAPSAELRPNQKDTDSLPPYEELDPVLDKITLAENPAPGDESGFYEIRRRVFKNQFKRAQSPRPLLVGGNPAPVWPLAGNYNTEI